MGAVLFQWGGKTVPLPARSIRYLESRDHGVVVHLEDSEQFFTMLLTQAEKLMPGQIPAPPGPAPRRSRR